MANLAECLERAQDAIVSADESCQLVLGRGGK